MSNPKNASACHCALAELDKRYQLPIGCGVVSIESRVAGIKHHNTVDPV
jgi:hypothetical protein